MRGLSKEFLDLMREKLKKGSYEGKWGWEEHWQNFNYPSDLFQCLQDEVIELAIALENFRLNKGSLDHVLYEAADVANFAMMIADIHIEKNKEY